MTDLKTITKRVSEVAKAAGAFIREERNKFSYSDVELKGKSDLVSYVDREAEKIIVPKLEELVPEAGFITEENTINQGAKEYTWIIDPLDGTTNFVHGLPTYAVSIALAKGEEVLIGVVYEINRDECFTAFKDGGANLNNQKIRISAASSISESLIATGFPAHDFHKSTEYLDILSDLMKDVHGLRRVGSAATDLAYVACGRYEGFFESNLKPWDVAAGILLVKEAGGFTTDFQGGSNYLFGAEIVAAGSVHKELLSLIQKYW